MSETEAIPSTIRPNYKVEILIVIALCLLAIGMRWREGPVNSTVIPGTLGIAKSLAYSDPPSMDELWHLTLTTGNATQFSEMPLNTIVRDLPSPTALDTAMPWWKVWTGMEYVVHPPLYVLSLRIWRNVFGESDTTAIAYSILWSCVAVTFIYLATRQIAGPAPAFWAAAVTAVSPTQVYFGLEVRAYAMVTAECAILLFILGRIMTRGATWPICIALGAALLTTSLTHYLTTTVCMVTGMLALFLSPGKQRLRVAITGVVIAGIYLVTWAPFFFKQQSHVGSLENSFLGIGTASLLTVFPRLLSLPLRLISEGWFDNPATMVIGAALLVGPLVLAYKHRALRPAAITAVLGCAGMICFDALKQTQLTALLRYNAHLTPAIFAGMFGSIALLRVAKNDMALHTVGVFAVFLCLTYRDMFPIRNDSPALFTVAQTVGPAIKAEQTLIIYSPVATQVAPWWVAMELLHLPGKTPRDVVLLQKPMTAELAAQLRTREAWLIPMTQSAVPEIIVPGYKAVESIPFTIDRRWPVSQNFRASHLVRQAPANDAKP